MDSIGKYGGLKLILPMFYLVRNLSLYRRILPGSRQQPPIISNVSRHDTLPTEIPRHLKISTPMRILLDDEFPFE